MFQAWVAPLNPQNSGVAGTALASSTTLTDISAAPQYTLPANFAQLTGSTGLRLTAGGVFSTTGTPTLLLGFYYGAVAGSALAATEAFTTASGVTNVQWRLEATLSFRTLGSSGTAWTQGWRFFGTAATTGTFGPLPGAAPAAVTVDTTAAKVISVGAQWGTSSASNTITCHSFLIESII